MNKKIIKQSSLVALCVLLVGTYFVNEKSNIDGEVKTDATKSNTFADEETSKMLNEVAEVQAKENDLITLSEAKERGIIGIDITEFTEDLTSLNKVAYPIIWSEPSEVESKYGVLYDLTFRNNEEIWVTTNEYNGIFKVGEVNKSMYMPPLLLFTNSETGDKVIYSRTSSDESNVLHNEDNTITYFYYTAEDFNYNNYDTVAIGQYKWAEFPVSEFIK